MFGKSRLLVLSLVLLLAVLLPDAPALADAHPPQPDLAMAQLTDLRIESSGGRRRLRFTTEIVNLGDARFEVRGTTSSANRLQKTTEQLVVEIVDGAYKDTYVATPAVMEFDVGDGHSHWHVIDLEKYELKRSPAEGDALLKLGAKRGFCFYDYHAYRLSLSGAPASAVYNSCQANANGIVTMGLSIGWGDIYYSNLAGQYVDLTDIKDGRYRLWATADAGGWFAEKSESNNRTWVDIQLKGRTVRVVDSAPNP